MDLKKFDQDLRAALVHANSSVPSIVSQRMDETLCALPELFNQENNVQVSFKILRTKWIVASIAVVLLFATAMTAPHVTANYLTYQAHNKNAYVIYQGYYYVTTGNHLEATEIGSQIAEVNRVGEWNILRDGDSNEFVPSSPIYAIVGNEFDDKIAVKATLNGFDFLSAYVELRRVEKVESNDLNTIESAKNDPAEVEIVLAKLNCPTVDTNACPQVDRYIDHT